MAAVTADDAWAVGDYFDPKARRGSVLIEHWDGTSWQKFATPRLDAYLMSVSADSPTDAWAAGYGGHGVALLHWDGTSWTAFTPNFGVRVIRGLHAVTAISPTDAWAVGYTGGRTSTFMTMHWNGIRWRVVPSALPRVGDGELESVSATGPDDVWAVGSYVTPKVFFRSFTEHWDGKVWTQVASPNQPPPDDTILYGVVALSPTRAWTVGYRLRPSRTVTDRWNGHRWGEVLSPDPGMLFGVDGTSRCDVWAVGYRGRHPLIEHWDGHAWTVA